MKMHHASLKLTWLFTLSIMALPLTGSAASSAKLDLSIAKSTNLTIYPDQGLIDQTFSVRLPSGQNDITFPVDPDFWGLSTLGLTATGSGGLNDSATSTSWSHASDSIENLLPYLIGKSITISIPRSNLAIKGRLISWKNKVGFLQGADGQVTMFHWQPSLLINTHFSSSEIKSFQNMIVDKNELSANFNLTTPANALHLNYVNNGLSLQNNYRVVLNPEHAKLQLSLKNTVTNNSTTSYPNADIILASSNNSNKFMGNRKGLAMMAGYEADSDSNAVSTRKWNTQFISVKGKHNIEANSSTSLNALTLSNIPVNTSYTYSFYGEHAISSSSVEHPQSLISFKAPQDLPSGDVQIYTPYNKSLLLVGSSQIQHSAKNALVTMHAGKAYTIDIYRKRMNVQQQGKEVGVKWKFTLVNHKKSPSTVKILDQSSSLVEINSNSPVKGHKVKVTLNPGQTKTIDLTTIYLKQK